MKNLRKKSEMCRNGHKSSETRDHVNQNAPKEHIFHTSGSTSGQDTDRSLEPLFEPPPGLPEPFLGGWATKDEQHIKKTRGQYRFYSIEQKVMAVQLVNLLFGDYMLAETILGISRKNLKRWVLFGVHSKKSRSKRVKNPQFDEDLFQWCVDQIGEERPLTRSSIRKHALAISPDPNFKGSRGWLAKFIGRHCLFVSSGRGRQAKNI